MNYSLKRKNDYKVLYSYNEVGFVIEKNKDNSKYKVSVSKITLVDKNLITYYITKSINKKFDKLFARMYEILTDDTDDSDSAPMILDEISKLKGIVVTKYKEYVSQEVYKEILKKLLIAEDEFKKDYNEKMFFKRVIEENNIEYEESRGKSR